MIERLEDILKRYNNVTEQLSTPEVLNDYNKMKTLSKEQSDLEEIVNKYNSYKQVIEEIEGSKEMLKDPELAPLAEQELPSLENQKEKLTQELEILLIPKDENDDKNIIMEIRGAAGGDEGNIFAGDLFDMYKKYAEKQGWHIEIMQEEKGEAGGFSQISFMIKGENVYSKLKYESGAHRVQRVPVTETQGRVHTSTATVLVMPEIEEVDSDLDLSEVRIDITRASIFPRE